MTQEQRMCEDAAGIRSSGRRLRFFDDAGQPVNLVTARRLVRAGSSVSVPDAGGGSWREVARLLGFNKIEVEDWTSSAGDWVFAIRGRRLLFQSNRYPSRGFAYSIAPRP